MSETSLQRRIVKAIKARWPLAWVYHPADHIHKGIPDLLICLDGKFIAIEVKVPGNKLTPLQLHTLDKIADAGGVAGWATSMEGALLTCERINPLVYPSGYTDEQ